VCGKSSIERADDVSRIPPLCRRSRKDVEPLRSNSNIECMKIQCPSEEKVGVCNLRNVEVEQRLICLMRSTPCLFCLLLLSGQPLKCVRKGIFVGSHLVASAYH
jgi:hypothetical protein